MWRGWNQLMQEFPDRTFQINITATPSRKAFPKPVPSILPQKTDYYNKVMQGNQNVCSNTTPSLLYQPSTSSHMDNNKKEEWNDDNAAETVRNILKNIEEKRASSQNQVKQHQKLVEVSEVYKNDSSDEDSDNDETRLVRMSKKEEEEFKKYRQKKLRLKSGSKNYKNRNIQIESQEQEEEFKRTVVYTDRKPMEEEFKGTNSKEEDAKKTSGQRFRIFNPYGSSGPSNQRHSNEVYRGMKNPDHEIRDKHKQNHLGITTQRYRKRCHLNIREDGQNIKFIPSRENHDVDDSDDHM